LANIWRNTNSYDKMTEHNKKLNLAFIGCGFATRIHSKTLSGLQERVKCYYASREPGKAESYNAEFSGSGAFNSYDNAVNSDVIDTVFIATPPSSHLQLTLQALEAGKHVIVEKPPFLRSDDFATVRQKQDDTGRRVLVAENYYYKPLLRKLRTLLHDKVIGELLFIHINALKEQKIKDWRGDLTLSGGGALFEGGIHWINFIASLGLELESVRGYRPAPRDDFEKSIMVSMQYKDGPAGTLYYSWETPSLFKGLRISKIYGRAGSITFESNGIIVILRGKQKRVFFPGFRDIAGYKAMFADFIESLLSAQEPEFTLQMAERDIRIIEQIYASC
jgi:predicted dehydrogenase